MEVLMATFKLVVYPFGAAIASLCIVMLVGMAAFGAEPKLWVPWQNQLVSSLGTVAAMAGTLAGAWLAVRAERRAARR
jgi:hypothetical protein